MGRNVGLSNYNARMDWRPFKLLLLATVVLVMPLVLLAFGGEMLAEPIARLQSDPPPRWVVAAAVVGILASDVFLPIPSGPVSTLAGSELGIIGGTIAACVGMTLGAAVAFGLSRRWGRPVAERFSTPQRLAEVEEACRRHGPWMLVLTRPLPVLAEAAALLVGALDMPWIAFLVPVAATNLALASAYATLGSQAGESEWLSIALAATIALPVAAAAWYQRRLRRPDR